MADRDVPQGLPSRRVWELAKMPPSTLNYWVQIGLVKPSLRGPEGRRVEQWWSVEDVVVVRTLRALRQAGVSLQQLRRVRKTLERSELSFANSRLLWDGHDVVLQASDGTISSALTRPGQQMLHLTALPIGTWHAEAEGKAEPVELGEFKKQRKERKRVQAQRVEPIERLL